jgi:hypothetical protein
MSVTVLAKRAYTETERIAAMEAPGKTKGRGAGGWVHDLCALKKVITLCAFCTHKFNPGRLGYVKEKEFPVVIANCDGCKSVMDRCTAYFFEETYTDVRSTAAARKAGRTADRKRAAKLYS